MKLFRKLASIVCAYHRNVSIGGAWAAKHEYNIFQLVHDHMPSGSGFYSGTHLDIDRSSGDCLLFTTAFHHMDDAGGYSFWTDHKVRVKPSLASEFSLTISGRNRNCIKDFIQERFDTALRTDVE